MRRIREISPRSCESVHRSPSHCRQDAYLRYSLPPPVSARLVPSCSLDRGPRGSTGPFTAVPKTHRGAAPYFFTFHTSHSLWEVRKHGTVARCRSRLPLQGQRRSPLPFIASRRGVMSRVARLTPRVHARLRNSERQGLKRKIPRTSPARLVAKVHLSEDHPSYDRS